MPTCLTRTDLARVVLTHVAATLGGAAAAWIGIPLPWMIGPLAVVAALALLGLPATTHPRLRNVGMLVIMTAIGLTFTPEAAAAAVGQLPLMLVSAVGAAVIGSLAALLLARMSGIDRITAFFCAVPGGPLEMTLLGERHGANIAPIAISQLLRIVGLVVTIPTVLALLGVRGDFIGVEHAIPVSAPGLALTLALALALTLVLVRLKWRTAFMFGPMLVGVVLGLGEAELSAFPHWLTAAAQVLMGGYLGAQFEMATMRRLGRFLPAALATTAVVAGGCAVLGIALAPLAGEAMPTLVLATAPGSVTEMCITAKVLGFDVPLITAFHLIRIFVIVLITPYIFAALRGLGVMRDAPAAALGQEGPAD